MERVYRVRVHGKVDRWKLEAMARGVTDKEGVRYRPMQAELVADGGGASEQYYGAGAGGVGGGRGLRRGQKGASRGPREWWREKKGGGGGGGGEGGGGEASRGGSNSWLRITCHEGKNRQIRKVCASLGLSVSRLVRVGFGPYDLRNCARGALLKVDAGRAVAYLDKAEDAAAKAAAAKAEAAKAAKAERKAAKEEEKEKKKTDGQKEGSRASSAWFSTPESFALSISPEELFRDFEDEIAFEEENFAYGDDDDDDEEDDDEDLALEGLEK